MVLWPTYRIRLLQRFRKFLVSLSGPIFWFSDLKKKQKSNNKPKSMLSLAYKPYHPSRNLRLTFDLWSQPSVALEPVCQSSGSTEQRWLYFICSHCGGYYDKATWQEHLKDSWLYFQGTDHHGGRVVRSLVTTVSTVGKQREMNPSSQPILSLDRWCCPREFYFC